MMHISNTPTREFGRYAFSYVCTIEPTRDVAGSVQQFLPQANFSKKGEVPLHLYGHGPFCKFRVSNSLRHQGVYTLTVDGNPYYVGECIDLSSRYNAGYGQISPRNCYEGGQRTNCRVNNLIYEATQQGRRVELWFFGTEKRKAVEAELIPRLNPKWNSKGLRKR